VWELAKVPALLLPSGRWNPGLENHFWKLTNNFLGWVAKRQTKPIRSSSLDRDWDQQPLAYGYDLNC
jgi:hypothetical protein